MKNNRTCFEQDLADRTFEFAKMMSLWCQWRENGNLKEENEFKELLMSRSAKSSLESRSVIVDNSVGVGDDVDDD